MYNALKYFLSISYRRALTQEFDLNAEKQQEYSLIVAKWAQARTQELGCIEKHDEFHLEEQKNA